MLVDKDRPLIRIFAWNLGKLPIPPDNTHPTNSNSNLTPNLNPNPNPTRDPAALCEAELLWCGADNISTGPPYCTDGPISAHDTSLAAAPTLTYHIPLPLIYRTHAHDTSIAYMLVLRVGFIMANHGSTLAAAPTLTRFRWDIPRKAHVQHSQCR